MNESNVLSGRTKIICTLGPASSSVEILEQMIKAGMDVARLNFSHGTHEEHRAVIDNVREASRRMGRAVTLLQDLQGPKIRTGTLKTKSVVLKDGAQFAITIDEAPGDEHRVSTTYTHLPKDVTPGDKILMDDGLLQLRVLRTTDREVVTEVVHGGVLKEHKGINLPGVAVSAPSCTPKDIEDLEFGIANGVDYVALSFVRSADDVRALRAIIESRMPDGRELPIVAKIEKPEALDNIDQILDVADAVMVARGDLGVECSPQDVPMAQKMICRKANGAGVPVIIATQMLESMIVNPRPTRAEASDVANAVLDGADAVMLSGETSVGKYVLEVVDTMDAIVLRAEAETSDRLDLPDEHCEDDSKVFRALGRSACVLAKRIGAAAIVTITHTGLAARNVAKYRPDCQIIAVTDRERTMRRLNLIWGVRSMLVSHLSDTDTTFAMLQQELVEQGFVKKGDYIVISAGTPLLERGTTNTLKVERIL
ncbi:MAG: pyruvate kinase [Ignavibacteriales bacterium]|nr:pyruvate kinase [Ignavibacteriales bacterium]